ncbi:AzlC family ABC transporter permease, partial [Rhodoplanes roseus]
MRNEDTGLRWFLRGVGGIVSVPAFILMASFIGFGVLCRESGITLGEAVFMTGFVWALPSQLVLVGAIAAGTP